MSRIAVLGASGRLGNDFVGHALDSGFRVSALSREPARVKRTADALTVFQGDAETGAGLELLLAGARHCVMMISPAKPVLAAETVVKALAAAKKLERFVYVTRMGVGDTEHQARKASGLLAPLMPRVRKGLYEELSRAEAVVRASELPWSIVHATWLTDDPPPGEVVATDVTAEEPPSRVGRHALAKFLLATLDDPSWLKREATVGTKRTA